MLIAHVVVRSEAWDGLSPTGEGRVFARWTGYIRLSVGDHFFLYPHPDYKNVMTVTECTPTSITIVPDALFEQYGDMPLCPCTPDGALRLMERLGPTRIAVLETVEIGAALLDGGRTWLITLDHVEDGGHGD